MPNDRSVRQAETLIDSGALSYSYLDSRFAEQLIAAGVAYDASTSTMVCGAIGNE